MKSNFSFKNIFGVIFILMGLFFNRVLLEKIFSIYAVIELNSRVPLLPASIGLIAFGLFLVFFKKGIFTFKKIGDTYKFLAITLFTTILLFIFANVLACFILIVQDFRHYNSQILLSTNKPLYNLYPSLSKFEVNRFLRETWSRPYVYEPYTQFKERPFQGKYINVSQEGFRQVKNQGPWPPSKDNFNIFLFGGSTIFNYGVPENETIASYLQELFIHRLKKVCIYNFGRGNYFSSQERILFEKLLSFGFIPDLAIFFDGLNDFYYFNDEPLFTKELENYLNGKSMFLSNLPILELINNLKSKYHSQNQDEANYDNKSLLNNVIQRYIRNKKLIEAVAKEYAVKPVFIWQPAPTYKYNLQYHIFGSKGFGRFMYSKYGYAEMEKYVKAHDMGTDFYWLADMQENLKKPLYIDIDHYSPEMSKEIAIKIYTFLQQ